MKVLHIAQAYLNLQSAFNFWNMLKMEKEVLNLQRLFYKIGMPYSL